MSASGSSFLSSLLGKQKKKEDSVKKQPTTVSYSKRVSQFDHSNEIIIKNKLFKGYSGLITKVFPPKVLVSFAETMVLKEEFPSAVRGDLVKLKIPPFSGVVMDEIPILYVIQMENGETYNLAKRFLDRILSFRHINEKGEEEYLTGILKSEEYKDGGIVYNIELENGRILSKQTLNISDEYWRVKNTNDRRIDNKTGKLMKIVPEQVVLSTSYTTFSPSQLKKHTGPTGPTGPGTVTVIGGELKGKVGKIVSETPKTFEIYLDLKNKKIRKINNKEIGEDDIFYKDFKLENDKYVQLISQINSDKFYVTDLDRNFEINRSQIKSFGKGFKLNYDMEELVKSFGEMQTEGPETEATETEGQGNFIEGSAEGPDDTEDLDTDGLGGLDDADTEPEGLEGPETQTYVSSYKDIERIVKEREMLTDSQVEIKKVLGDLFDYFLVNPQDTNVADLIKSVEDVKAFMINKLTESGHKDVFSKNDLKFLCVVVMYIYFVKHGDVRASISEFYDKTVGKLIENKYFKPIDVKSSSWYLIRPSTQKQFDKKVAEIISICMEMANEVLGEIKEEIQTKPFDIFPVGKKRSLDTTDSFVRSEYTSKRGTTVTQIGQLPIDYKGRPITDIKLRPRFVDYKKNIQLNKDAQMLWTEQQMKIIQILKDKLSKAILDQRFVNYKNLLQFALENIDNIYVNIANLEKSGGDSKNLAYLKQIATILTREFDKLETQKSMLKMKKQLHKTEKQQKKLAYQEGLIKTTRDEEEEDISQLDIDRELNEIIDKELSESLKLPKP
jgi:ribosomal protein L24